MIWLLIVVSVFAIDLWMKHYIDTHKEEDCYEPICHGHIVVTRFHNQGAMLGVLKDKPRMLLGITVLGLGLLVAALFGSIRKQQPFLVKLGLSLLLGGAASNAYDRVLKREVTDYFRICIGSKKLEKVIFNLGDIAIFIGAFLSLIGLANESK